MADFIVAIELGSSKATGIAGKKNLDGSFTVLSVVTEDSSSCIRKGVVYNIDKTVQTISGIIHRLETALKHKIARVYVGVGGQSIHSMLEPHVKELPEGTIVSQDMINELSDGNRSMQYPEQVILDAVTQEFKVDSQYQIDPVGIQCSRLEGNFLNILWRSAYYRNFNQCFDKVGISIAEMYLSPLALADAVLTETEKRSGCVLIDMGADTTTVAVYHKSILRNLTVVPLGGNNITKDIASQQIDDHEAEKMKLKYASAYTDNNDIQPNAKYAIDSERSIEQSRFVEIVEARVQEIIENAWHQVPTEYLDKLIGGIILTGGMSKMKNIETAVRTFTNIQKVRIAGTVIPTIIGNNPLINAHDGTMNTILGLLTKGEINCAGDTISQTLFGEEKPASTNAPAGTATKTAPSGSGVVKPAVDKAAEEAKRKAAEEEAERKRKEEEEAERQRNNPNRWTNRLKTFFKSIVSEEEEEK